MRPIATDVPRSVVCVSVCVLFTWMCCAQTIEMIEMSIGADSRGSKILCSRWGKDPHQKGQFWGLFGPMKSIVSLCYSVHSKSSIEIMAYSKREQLNNGMTAPLL